MKLPFSPLTWCSSSLLPQRSERSEPGALGYKLDGVDGSLEYDPADDVDKDRACFPTDCDTEDITIVPLSTGLRGDGGIE